MPRSGCSALHGVNPNLKKKKKEKAKQLSGWSVMNINHFKGKVRIKFVFTFYFMDFLTCTTWVTAHWNSLFLVDFLWISCLGNRSKKVNLSIFAVLNMSASLLVLGHYDS